MINLYFFSVHSLVAFFVGVMMLFLFFLMLELPPMRWLEETGYKITLYGVGAAGALVLLASWVIILIQGCVFIHNL